MYTGNMFNQLKNNISLASFTVPVYAALKVTPQGDEFSSLEGVTIESVVSGAISLALIVIVVVFFFMLILGAFKWITGGSDEKKIAGARGQITNALIGLAIVFAAWAILSLISTIFDVKILDGFSLPSFTEGSSSSASSTSTKSNSTYYYYSGGCINAGSYISPSACMTDHGGATCYSSLNSCQSANKKSYYYYDGNNCIQTSSSDYQSIVSCEVTYNTCYSTLDKCQSANP